MARNTQYVYERAKDLLQKNIDGFIFLNNGPIVMNDETNNMLKLLYYDTRELNQNFTFKSCLFILSKSDIHPDLNVEECKKILCDWFQEFEQSITNNTKNLEKIEDFRNLNIIKLSNIKYNNYNVFLKNSDNFVDYINSLIIKIKQKNPNEQEFKNVIIKGLLYNMKKNPEFHIDNSQFNEYNPKEEEIDIILLQLKEILNFTYNISENILEQNSKNLKEIAKCYCFLQTYKKLYKFFSKSYQESNWEELENKFNFLINNAEKYSHIFLNAQVADFFIYTFKSIEGIRATKIEKTIILHEIKEDDFNRIKNDIDCEYNYTLDSINSDFSALERATDSNIYSIERYINQVDDFIKTFKNKANDNYNMLYNIKNKINNHLSNFFSYSKNKIISLKEKSGLKDDYISNQIISTYSSFSNSYINNDYDLSNSDSKFNSKLALIPIVGWIGGIKHLVHDYTPEHKTAISQ